MRLNGWHHITRSLWKLGVELPTKSPDLSTKEHIMAYLQTCPHFAADTAPAEIFQRMLPQRIKIHRLALKASQHITCLHQYLRDQNHGN